MGQRLTGMSGNQSILPLAGSVYKFAQHGQAGAWVSELLPHTARIGFDALECGKRPVSAVADHVEVREVERVEVREDRDIALTVLFDPELTLEERILKEQFQP